MSDPHFDPISEKKVYAQPDNMKLENIPGGVEISRRWSVKLNNFLFGSLALIVLIVDLQSLLSGPLASGWLWGIFLLIICLLLVYSSLAQLLNSSRFSVVMGEITVRKGPLPVLPGRQVFSAAQVASLSFQGVKHRSQNSTTYDYPVAVTLRDGKRIVLDTCDKEDQAGFLCQELRRCLGISDQPTDEDLAVKPQLPAAPTTFSEEDINFQRWLNGLSFTHFPAVSGFQQDHPWAHIEARGEREGVEFIQFNTYMLFTLKDRDLPDFLLEKRSLLNRTGSIQFDKNSFFDAEYAVKSPDEPGTRRVFSKPVRDYIRNYRVDLIEAKGCQVLFENFKQKEADGAVHDPFELLQMMRQAGKG